MLPSLDEISKRRRVLGLTQSKLSTLSNVSQSLIAKIERGKIDPTYSRIRRIFDCLENMEKDSGKSVKDVMSTRIIKVSKDVKIDKAVRLMKDNDVSQIVVVSRGKIVGSILDGLIIDRVAAGEDAAKLSTRKVEEVMNEPFPQVSENTPINIISPLFHHNNAVLVMKKSKVVGIVTKADLLKVVHM